MKDQLETLSFFRNAINLIVVEVERRMKELSEGAERELQILTTLARKVGLEVPPLSAQAERIASELTWAPIAERYLVALMQPLIQKANSSPKHSRRDCQDLWKGTVDFRELARENGLSPVDAPVVQSSVEMVLFDSDLLKQRVTLDWNGRNYSVRRDDNWLIVEG